jgi:hypothetical protein
LKQLPKAIKRRVAAPHNTPRRNPKEIWGITKKFADRFEVMCILRGDELTESASNFVLWRSAHGIHCQHCNSSEDNEGCGKMRTHDLAPPES